MAEKLKAANGGTCAFIDIYFPKEKADFFLEQLRPCWEAVVAEPECISFEVFRTDDNPEYVNFRFVECWAASIEWLMNVQLQKEYYKPYLAVTEPLFVKPREVKVFTCEPDWVVAKPSYFKPS
ncbi:hypothetical protein BDY21DRAFT_341923 [Lineolata rhizophorae]|uniref:ABM domain-containing protein n=1 Tax=Lineolata rhizophorae TaxID=578093 RepID=A0A6A6P2W1_9PEZI|nr:hypothetical protein BDY21DRAFT_341923 [Lineolata rhizophorae]